MSPIFVKLICNYFLKDYVIMSQNNVPRKKCVTLLSENMDPSISARIIISYYSSNQTKRYRYVQRVYLKHGPLVVSTVKYPKVSVHHTLRAMLIAVSLYPKFLNLVPSVRSILILRSWVKAFLTVNVRKYTHLPLKTLLKEAISIEVVPFM